MTSMRLIEISDRDYTSWTILYNGEINNDYYIDPKEKKLFNGDSFKIEDDKIVIKNSPIRESSKIYGILVLGQNKTYGKYKNRPLYKFIPNEKTLPMFLVPYEQKNNFSKNYKNKYVVVKFENWEDKHPKAKLVDNYGDVSNIEAFYTYQLNSRGINIPYKSFVNKTKYLEKNKFDITNLLNTYENIADHQKENVFTVDPEGCLDFDDAVSIQKDKKAKYILRIYISNVSIWLDYLNLWNIFSDRVSTIYFPDKNYPMIPTVLSNNLCSLKAGNTRVAFVCEIHINKLKIVDIKYYNASIKVEKNYVYEEKDLLTMTDYLRVYNLTINLNNEKETNYLPCINDSHDVIAYLMIMMNHVCAKDMGIHKNGLYRSIKLKEDEIENVPEKIRTFVYLLRNSSGGKYVKYCDEIGHDVLNLEQYIQITSPIRRLVDMLNMIQFQNNHNIVKWKNERNQNQFYIKWLERLDYINEKMKQIKKAQNDCNSLYLCTTNVELLNDLHDGYIIEKNQEDTIYNYMVYLYETKMIVKMKNILDLPIYSNHKFKIFVFNDENSLKQKVKVQMFD